jgi:hypothetical protein
MIQRMPRIAFASAHHRQARFSQISHERREQILEQAVDAGIAGGGTLGDGGLVNVDLYVLDEPSLATLASIADPDEVCVSGQDPADYVEPGPQREAGEGWRWLGSSETRWSPDEDLVRDSEEFEMLWATMFPRDSPMMPEIDFQSETVLVLQTNRGIEPGPCGYRFDGLYRTASGLLVAKMFKPGGEVACPTTFDPGTYAVAIDHAATGEPPFEFAIQYGPRQEPEVKGTLH